MGPGDGVTGPIEQKGRKMDKKRAQSGTKCKKSRTALTARCKVSIAEF